MDTQSGFHRAEVATLRPIIRPPIDDRNAKPCHRARIFEVHEAEMKAEETESKEFWESLICEPCEAEDDDQPGCPVKLPRSFRKPTKQEVLEHMSSHWPFRSWCKHCVFGRSAGAHHKARSDIDREFARSGVPMISIDHCFLGSADDDTSAHSSPFLVIFDNPSEALYAIAVGDKKAKAWIVE